MTTEEFAQHYEVQRAVVVLREENERLKAENAALRAELDAAAVRGAYLAMVAVEHGWDPTREPADDTGGGASRAPQCVGPSAEPTESAEG